MTIRILLVDDHTVVRKGLRTFLSYNPDLEVEGSAADGAQALSLARELTPDVVVMDPACVGDGWHCRHCSDPARIARDQGTAPDQRPGRCLGHRSGACRCQSICW